MIFVYVAVCDNENIQSLMIHRRRCQILLQRFCRDFALLLVVMATLTEVKICVDGRFRINHLMIYVRDLGE